MAEDKTLLTFDVDAGKGRAELAKLREEVANVQQSVTAMNEAAAKAASTVSAAARPTGFDITGNSERKAIIAEEERAAQQAALAEQRAGQQQREAEHEAWLRRVGQRGREMYAEYSAFGGSADENKAAVDRKLTEEALLGTGDATRKLGETSQLTRKDINDLAAGLAALNPELGMLARMAIQAREAVRVLFAGVSAGAAVAAAAVLAVVAAFAAVSSAIDKAAANAARFRKEMDRVKGSSLQVEEGVAEQLGGLGKGTEAAHNKATAVSKRLRDQGFAGQTADSVAASVVDDEGNVTIPDEDLSLLAAGVQRGDIDLPASGTNRGKQIRAMAIAKMKIGRNRDSLSRSVAAYTRPASKQAEGLRSGDPFSVEAALLEEGYSPEDAKKTAADMAEMDRRGTGSGPSVRRAVRGTADSGVAGGFEDEGLLGEAWQDVSSGVIGPVLNAVGVPWVSGREERIQRSNEARQRIQAKAPAQPPPPGQAGGGQAPIIYNNYGISQVGSMPGLSGRVERTSGGAAF